MSTNTNYNSFSTSKGIETSFLESNSLLTKFAFIIIVVFSFVILLKIGISVIGYFMTPSKSPHLINGMVDAKNAIVFSQDPSNKNNVKIPRSTNETTGIEFTWSVWIYVNSFNYQQGQYKHIFHKGDSNLANDGLNFPNNAPGLYLAPNTNKLVVIMNTFDVINEEVSISDIPANKWLNIIIRCKNKTLDVYVNGTIARSLQLTSVPKQNYGDVFVGMNGGFDGYISNLWYYNYALGIGAIQNIANGGADTRMLGSNGMKLRDPNFLSLRWFFNDNRNMMLQ